MSKKVLSVTVDQEVLNSLKKIAEEKCLNLSKLIEKMIKEYLKNTRKK